MEIRAAAATDRGRVREQNEDAVLGDVPLVAVADGMGGHAAGEVASSMALETLASWKERLSGASGKQTADMLRDAVNEANRNIWEKGQDDQSLLGMGTTLTAGWISEGSVTFAHVGDSRIYLLRAGTLEQLTTDQNVAQDLVRRGRISEDEAASSPHRHVILQAVGADPGGLDVEVGNVDLQAGDRLMLATDGLFGMIRSPDRLREILTEHSDPAEACRVLIEEANVAGGEDNISVVLVDAIADEAGASPSAATGATAAEADVLVERPTEPPPAEGPSRLRPMIIGAIAVIAIGAGIFFVTRLGDDRLLVAERGGAVVLMHGRPGTGGDPATGDVVEVFTDERVDRFPRTVREDLRSGIPVGSMTEARRVVANLPRLLGPLDTPTPSPSPTPVATVTGDLGATPGLRGPAP